MAYRINDDCITCGACEAECKNEAIKEGDTVYVINPDKCTECVGWFAKPKCVEVCPADACVLDPQHKESKEQLLEKWKKLHPGKTPQA
jgi:ferredoxin